MADSIRASLLPSIAMIFGEPAGSLNGTAGVVPRELVKVAAGMRHRLASESSLTADNIQVDMSPKNLNDGQRPTLPGLEPRVVRESQSQMAEVVLPNDANQLGNLLGGRLMHLIDIAGAMAAHRHSHSHVVTASMDHIDFREPVHIGDLLILKSSVNRAFNTSMEVGVKCWVENYISGQTRHVASAYLTFVAIDQQGKHKPVPPVVPETDEEKRRYEDAGRRRDLRRWELGSRAKKSP